MGSGMNEKHQRCSMQEKTVSDAGEWASERKPQVQSMSR